MMDFVYTAESAVSVGLQLLLVVLLLQNNFRKYFVLLMYSLVYLMTSLVEVIVFRWGGGKATVIYRNVYWTNEVILDLLLFLTVAVLTLEAAKGITGGIDIGKATRRVLTVAVAGALVLPFAIGFGSWFTQRWFNLTSQFLNFGGAIMNLALWSALIASKRRDSQLLLVSAGLGIAIAGASINYGVRLMSAPGPSPLKQLADVFGVVAHVAGVAIWCWAFRPAARVRGDGAQVLAKTS